MFSATMHRVDFSHLQVPADFARKKKKVYLGLDIKSQCEGKKISIFTGDLKTTLLILCFSGTFIKYFYKRSNAPHVIRIVKN